MDPVFVSALLAAIISRHYRMMVTDSFCQRAFACIILFLFSFPLQSRENDIPDWVRLDQAKRLFDSGNFDEALRVFIDLREKKDSYPEADFWIGRVYEEEGELNLAEIQYMRALDTRRDLYVYEDVLRIHERLAYIYRISRQYHKYEDILKAGLEFTPEWSAPESSRLVHLMIRTLKDRGLDRLFELYRRNDSKVLHIHSELGLFYYRTGRYEESIRHLVNATLTILTRINSELIYHDPVYRPESVSSMLSMAMGHERVIQYSENVSLYPVLYYLAGSLYALGDVKQSREIFTIVANTSTSSDWVSKAGRQLASPYIEPILTSQEYFYF